MEQETKFLSTIGNFTWVCCVGSQRVNPWQCPLPYNIEVGVMIRSTKIFIDFKKFKNFCYNVIPPIINYMIYLGSTYLV